jgi:hypothetical protein
LVISDLLYRGAQDKYEEFRVIEVNTTSKQLNGWLSSSAPVISLGEFIDIFLALPPAIRIDDYTVIFVDKNTIKVGCATVKREIITKILEQMNTGPYNS